MYCVYFTRIFTSVPAFKTKHLYQLYIDIQLSILPCYGRKKEELKSQETWCLCSHLCSELLSSPKNSHYFSSNLIPSNCEVPGIIRKCCSHNLPWTTSSITHTYKIHYLAPSLWFFLKGNLDFYIATKRTDLEYSVTINIRDQNYTVH